MKSLEPSRIRFRCKSSVPSSGEIFLCSILKDPKKSKLKHQRSVRFEEPEFFSNENSFEKTKPVFSCHTPNDSIPSSPLALRTIISQCPDLKTLNKKPPRPNPKQNNSQNSTPVKIVSKVKPKSRGTKDLDRLNPKTLNYQFRDKGFYDKLNKFIYSKACSDSEKVFEKDISQYSKKIEKNIENNVNTNVSMKKGKNGIVSRYLSPQSQNLLN